MEVRRWALASLDGVAPSWMVGVSTSVNLPLHQKFSSGTGLPGWSRKKSRKTVVVVVVRFCIVVVFIESLRVSSIPPMLLIRCATTNDRL